MVVAIALEDRVCRCGCNVAFRTMPDSKQVYATVKCAGKEAPKWTPAARFPTKEEQANKKVRSLVELGKLPEPKRPREEYKMRPRPAGDWQTEWNRLVSRAREMVLQMNRFRMEVAQCAIDACDIRLGGGAHWSGHKGVKTLKNFAIEVGISYKTLHTWVDVKKKVVDVLPDGVYDETNFGAAARTLQEKVRRHGSSEVTKEQVGEWYDKELGRVGSTYNLFQIIKTMRNVSYRTALLNLELCDAGEKKTLRELAERIIKILDEDEK